MTLASRIRNACNLVLSPFDVEILRRSRQRNDPWSRLRLLSDVATVIDVGVGDAGTPELYRHFPNAQFISIDPLQECRHVVDALVPSTAAGSEFHAVGLGSEEGVMPLQVTGKLSRSSLRERSWVADNTYRTREVRRIPVRRLDTLLAADALHQATLLKIDTEGYELAVLQGSVGLLPRIAYVLLEISTTENFEGGESVADIYAWLASHGYTQSFVAQSELVFMNVCFFKSGTPVDAFIKRQTD